MLFDRVVNHTAGVQVKKALNGNVVTRGREKQDARYAMEDQGMLSKGCSFTSAL